MFPTTSSTLTGKEILACEEALFQRANGLLRDIATQIYSTFFQIPRSDEHRFDDVREQLDMAALEHLILVVPGQRTERHSHKGKQPSSISDLISPCNVF